VGRGIIERGSAIFEAEEEVAMRRFSYAVARVGCFFLLMLTLGSSLASALPPADGSKCKPDWVNNPGAMDCFVKGEEEIRNGVSHPHYVACTNDGDVMCCVNNDNGAQNCEAVKASGPRRPIEAVQLGAILDAQQTILTLLGRICAKVDCSPSKPTEGNR
jgi:hypothetical protein